jgi:5'-AMP-activated protein kinase, catalytic alpha subunit
MALAAHLDEYGPDAIKILDKKDIKANELTVNVRREIAIMKALNHKNIVNLREVLSSKSKLYIVMDLVRGGELFEMINRKGELDEKLARSYFEQLVDGIDYCHRRGVLHRDLKPENLLVDEKGTLMITEFGVSSMKGGVAGSDILYTACGTPYYCALEIFNGAEEGYKGVKIDAWSCGIILYLLLTGSLPFINEDITHL